MNGIQEIYEIAIFWGSILVWLGLKAASVLLFLYGFCCLAAAVKTMQKATVQFAGLVQAEAILGIGFQLMAAIMWWAV